MDPQSCFEQDEDALFAEFNRGDISHEEFEKQLKELRRDYQDQAKDAAHEAYEREMSRW